jgi:hypothetical protein
MNLVTPHMLEHRQTLPLTRSNGKTVRRQAPLYRSHCKKQYLHTS